MTKKGEERFTGEITEVLPDQKYRVKLEDNGKEILAHLCGKMRQNKIKVILSDKVVVSMCLNYDTNRGIIVERPGVRGKRGTGGNFGKRGFTQQKKRR
jgi:translation initiation factor IF-1